MEKFLLNLTWVRCSLLNKSAVGRVKGHLNKMVVPIEKGMEDQLLINLRLVRGVHWAHNKAFREKDIIWLPLTMWDVNKYTLPFHPPS